GLNTTDSAKNNPIGWLTNPYFASLYDAKAQNALLDTRAFNGHLVDLKGTQSPFEREAILEQTNTFQFIAYSLQSDQPGQTANQFNPGVLRNKQYGVVTLTQKFGDADPIKTSSGLYLWTQGSSSSFSETQPAASLFNTQTLGRAADGTLLAPAPETPAATARERSYESIPNLVYTNEYPQGQNYYTGRRIFVGIDKIGNGLITTFASGCCWRT